MVPEPAPAASPPPDGFEVLDACHREMLQQLQALDALVHRLSGSALDAQQRDDVERAIAFFTGTARVHNSDEERHVFPVLRRGGDEALAQEVDRLSEDHAWIEIHWLDVQAQLEAALAGLRSYGPQALRSAVDPFLAISREHIEAEERLLYPQARARMAPRERRAMTRSLTSPAPRPRR